MASAVHQGNLQYLAQRLQESLQSDQADRWLKALQSVPLQVECALRQGNLLVLSQHPPVDSFLSQDLETSTQPTSTLPPELSEQVFTKLEQTIQACSSDLVDSLELPLSPNCSQVKLYLRVLGQKHPYAIHTFLFSPLGQISAQEADLQLSGAAVPKREMDVEFDNLTQQAHEATDEPLEQAIADQFSDDLPDDQPWSMLPDEAAPETSDKPTKSWLKRSPFLPWQMAGMIGVSIAGFASGIFVMTRPCVLGQCDVIQTSQTLNQQAFQSVKSAKSPEEFKQAQQLLIQANQQLGEIPFWSSHHPEAQTLLQTYQAQVSTLEQLLSAETKAQSANQKSQVAQSSNDWQMTQTLWREVITQLEAIPQSSPFYPTAEQRIAFYRSKLGGTGQRMSEEQQSQKKLATAKATAKIAETRQGVAQTLENWQLTRATWEVVVNTLKGIPQGTTSFTEAQQLLTSYEPKLAAARDRATQEQIANKAFTQATNLEQRAKNSEQQNQWSQAVANWRDALNYANQVPKDTFYRNQVEPLIPTYTNALKLAESKLKAAQALQTIRGDVERVCGGSPKTCYYTITRDLIRIQFTSEYERAVRTAFIVGQSGDAKTLGGTMNHLESLQSAMQAISNNAGVPVQIYSSDKELVGSFNPGN